MSSGGKGSNNKDANSDSEDALAVVADVPTLLKKYAGKEDMLFLALGIAITVANETQRMMMMDSEEAKQIDKIKIQRVSGELRLNRIDDS